MDWGNLLSVGVVILLVVLMMRGCRRYDARGRVRNGKRVSWQLQPRRISAKRRFIAA